jgi:hypothetical protein
MIMRFIPAGGLGYGMHDLGGSQVCLPCLGLPCRTNHLDNKQALLVTPHAISGGNKISTGCISHAALIVNDDNNLRRYFPQEA